MTGSGVRSRGRKHISRIRKVLHEDCQFSVEQPLHEPNQWRLVLAEKPRHMKRERDFFTRDQQHKHVPILNFNGTPTRTQEPWTRNWWFDALSSLDEGTTKERTLPLSFLGLQLIAGPPEEYDRHRC